MGCVTICISDELEIAFRRLVRLKYGEKQGKISRGATEAIFDWCQRERIKLLDEDQLLEDEWWTMVNENNDQNGQDLGSLSKEVDKFLEERETYIRESIIGSRAIESLEDFTLDVGLKKTYLCTKNTKESYPVLAKVIELFIKVYGATVTMYPKGEKVCLELITPKRE